jgi:hypothetical protein
MKSQRRVTILMIAFLAILIIVRPSPVAADKLTDTQNIHAGWSTTYVALEKGLPRLYRNFLKTYQGSLEKLVEASPTSAADKIMLERTNIIKALSDYVKYGTAIFGIGKEVALGNNEKAAFKTAMFVASELVSTESAKALLTGTLSVSAIYFTGLFTAVDIAYESQVLATEMTNAARIESLLGGLEGMFRATSADVDKMPVTPENVDKVWKRVLNEQDFRDRFKAYVTEVLQKPFPEVMTPFREKFDPPFTEQDKEKLMREALLARQGEFTQYIAGILSELNNKAKAERKAQKDRLEAMTILKDLEAKIKLLKETSNEEFAKNYVEAYKRLQKAKAYSDTLPASITRAVRENDDGALDVELNIMKNYIESCLVWLPDDGQVGGDKKLLMMIFQRYYDFAARASDEIKLEKKLAPSSFKTGKAGGDSQSGEGSASVDFSDMLALANEAWDALKANKIDGGAYSATLSLAKEGASIKVGEALKPFYKRIQDTSASFAEEKQGITRQLIAASELIAQENKNPDNFYWNPYVGDVRKNTPGMQQYWQWVMEGRACDAKWGAELNRLYTELLETSTKFWEACNKCISTIEQQRNERYKVEGEALIGFLNRLKRWGESTIDVAEYGYDWSTYSGTSKKKSYQLRSIGYSGEGLAANILIPPSRYMKTLIGNMGIPSFWSIIGAKSQSAARLEEATKISATISDVLSSTKASENAASGLASEAPALADALEPNVEVWQYVRSYPNSSLGIDLDAREDFPRLKTYLENYRTTRETYMSEIPAMDQERNELLDKRRRAAEALSKEKAVVDAAVKTLESISLTSERSRADIDMYGKSQMSTLAINGVTTKSINDMEELLADFASSDKLQAYVLTLIPGEKTYDASIKAILPKEVIDALRRIAKSRMTAVAANRDSYERAYKDFKSASASLDEILKSVQELLKDASPSLSSMLERGNVLTTVKQALLKDLSIYVDYLSFCPPDPAEFADPDYGVMARLDKYEELAEKYHSLVDPELKKIARTHRRETRMLNDIADMVDREGASWMALGSSEFNKKCNDVSQSAWSIINPISISGESEPGSPVLKAYYRVMTSMMNISGKFYAAEALRALKADLSAITGGVSRFLSAPETYGGVSTAKEWLKALQKYTDPASSAMKMKSSDTNLSSLMDEVNRQTPQLQKIVDAETAKSQAMITADIKAFYDRFKSAYEGRNDALLMGFISGEWQAGDGSTLSALQANLRRIFKMFDEIRYNIQNLSLTPAEAGRYLVSYDVTITSKIYKRNLTHEEKSSINEEVIIDSSGKVKISKTLGGKSWYIQ